MPYDDKQLTGYVLLVDAQGTAENDVAAPPEGQTLLYTTEQGLVLERQPTEGFAARQWFLDQPALLEGNGEPNALSGTPQSILALPYVVPDDIDANFPTIYRIELGVVVSNFVPDASSAGIWVQPFVDGDNAAPPALVPCDAAAGEGGTTVTFFVAAEAGLEIDVRAYLINSADAADAAAYFGLVKRELRLSGFGG